MPFFRIYFYYAVEFQYIFSSIFTNRCNCYTNNCAVQLRLSQKRKAAKGPEEENWVWGNGTITHQTSGLNSQRLIARVCISPSDLIQRPQSPFLLRDPCHILETLTNSGAQTVLFAQPTLFYKIAFYFPGEDMMQCARGIYAGFAGHIYLVSWWQTIRNAFFHDPLLSPFALFSSHQPESCALFTMWNYILSI